MKAGLGHLKVTPHKLRHTAASLAIASGADVNVVQTMLGHKSATLTLDTYGHLSSPIAWTTLEKAEKKARKAAEAVTVLEDPAA